MGHEGLLVVLLAGRRDDDGLGLRRNVRSGRRGVDNDGLNGRLGLFTHGWCGGEVASGGVESGRTRWGRNHARESFAILALVVWKLAGQPPPSARNAMQDSNSDQVEPEQSTSTSSPAPDFSRPPVILAGATAPLRRTRPGDAFYRDAQVSASFLGLTETMLTCFA